MPDYPWSRGIVKKNPKYSMFVDALPILPPKYVQSALSPPQWFNTMQQEFDAMIHNT